MKYTKLLPYLVLFAGVLGFVALMATRPKQAQIAPKERIWQVETISAAPQRLAPVLTLYGQVESPDLLKAAAPSGSRVHRVHIREGAAVEPEQLLLELDPRDFTPRVAQADAQVAELEAQINSEKLRYSSDRKAYRHERSLLELGRKAVTRAELMKIKKLGSVAALDEAEENLERQQLAVTTRKLALDDHNARLKQLDARLERARADLQLAKLDLERSRVLSPFKGFVATIEVAEGDQVNANQQLLSLYPVDSMEVRAKIPAVYQAELQSALLDGKSLKATTDLAGKNASLKLNRLAGQADARGIDALFTFSEGAETVRLGMALTVHLQRPPQENAIAVPFPALYDNNRVYLLEEGRLKGVVVRTLGEYLDADGTAQLLVTSPNLHTGDRIVTTHLPNAVSGLRAATRAAPAQ